MNTVFQKGARVLFYGDSITDAGRSRTVDTEWGRGYAARTARAYQALLPEQEIVFLNRGISGNTSADLLTRYEQDVLALQPDFVSVMIGINDTWRRYDSNDITSKEQFETNLTELLEKIKKGLPDTKLMLIEPFLLPTDPEKEIFWEDLGPKIEVVRRLARKYADVYLPMNGILTNSLIEKVPTEELSYDGVHLSDPGCAIMAKEYLKAWAAIEK